MTRHRNLRTSTYIPFSRARPRADNDGVLRPWRGRGGAPHQCPSQSEFDLSDLHFRRECLRHYDASSECAHVSIK